jgi:Protein of unknown function (DUF2628)
MSQYRVWKNPDTKVVETVKQGWSWIAFLFPVPWALVKRMHVIAILTFLSIVVIFIAIDFIDSTLIEDEESHLILILNGINCVIFGANGNFWREWYLRKRGFVFRKTVRLSPFRNFVEHPIAGFTTFWNDPVWSKVISGIILAIGGAITAYFFFPSSNPISYDTAQSHHRYVEGCKRATISGSITTDEEVFAWFEWGETPNLGNISIKQRFAEDTEYYQDLTELKENTTYFYKVAGIGSSGVIFEGRVNSFTTARC